MFANINYRLVVKFMSNCESLCLLRVLYQTKNREEFFFCKMAKLCMLFSSRNLTLLKNRAVLQLNYTFKLLHKVWKLLD